MSALRRMRETDRPIAFRPWIHEIARNACIDQFRRARRGEEIPFERRRGRRCRPPRPSGPAGGDARRRPGHQGADPAAVRRLRRAVAQPPRDPRPARARGPVLPRDRRSHGPLAPGRGEHALPRAAPAHRGVRRASVRAALRARAGRPLGGRGHRLAPARPAPDRPPPLPLPALPAPCARAGHLPGRPSPSACVSAWRLSCPSRRSCAGAAAGARARRSGRRRHDGPRPRGGRLVAGPRRLPGAGGELDQGGGRRGGASRSPAWGRAWPPGTPRRRPRASAHRPVATAPATASTRSARAGDQRLRPAALPHDSRLRRRPRAREDAGGWRRSLRRERRLRAAPRGAGPVDAGRARSPRRRGEADRRGGRGPGRRARPEGSPACSCRRCRTFRCPVSPASRRSFRPLPSSCPSRSARRPIRSWAR